MEISSQQSKFEGWAVVDALGHQRHAGHVTSEHFGQTVLFRVVSPARDARVRDIAEGRGEFVDGYGYLDTGMKVSEAAVAETERYIGAGSVYMLTPTPRHRVMEVLDEINPRAVLGVLNADGTPYEKPKRDDDDGPF